MLNVPKEKIAESIELHGLSTKEQRWWRRPIYAGLKCAACKQTKGGGAMYEYGVSIGNGPITWDGKVYCNMKCLPDDTLGIRRERWSVRKAKSSNGARKLQLVKARAQERLERLTKRYRELLAVNDPAPVVRLAREEGVSKQKMSRLLHRAGVA